MTKQPAILLCGCGCGVSCDWRRMEFVRRGARQVLVLPGCAEHAEAEFAAREALTRMLVAMRGLPFWRRWPYAAAVFRHRVTADRRLKVDAHWLAFRAAVKLCLPK